MELAIGDVLDATGATLLTEPPEAGYGRVAALRVAAAVIDSRLVGPGDLFVALPGTRTDGARFVGDAYARGARAVLTPRAPAIADEQRAARRAAVGDDAPFAALVVPDVLEGLGRTAAYWRARHPNVRVVGITGSVGKTTTREAVAAVLAPAMPTLVSERSYNNEIGLPLTLLGLEERHRAAVLEMGMYAPGEIAALAALARPRIGVVTMVAPVHLERLGSLEAIAAAKAELVRALPSDGVAALNGDDPLVRAMAAQTAARTVLYGFDAGNLWQARDPRDDGLDGLAFTLVRHDLQGREGPGGREGREGREGTGEWTARVESPVVGRHIVPALLAAAVVAEALGLPREEIAAALARVRIGERQRILAGPGGRLIIDDAWNASLPSMLAALDVLAAVPRRRVAVLGEMRELGAASEEAHRAVGRRAGEVAQVLIAVGPGGTTLAEEACRAGLPRAAVVTVATSAEADTALATVLRPGDGVLVKGSRALHLEDTVRWLLGAETGTGTGAETGTGTGAETETGTGTGTGAETGMGA